MAYLMPLRLLPGSRRIFQQPADLSRRKIRWQLKTCSQPDLFCHLLYLFALTDLSCPCALPHDRVIERLSRLPIPFLTFRCPCPDIRSCPIILAFLILWNLYSSLNFTFITSCNSLLGLLCQDSNSVTQFWPQLFLKTVLVLHLSYIKFRKM